MAASPSPATSDSAASISEGAGGGCPVKHGGSQSGASGGGGVGYWSSLFGGGGVAGGSSEGSDIVSPVTPPTGNGAGGCPVKHDAVGTGSRGAGSFPFAGAGKAAASTPASLEEAARHPQSPRPDQTVPLSTVRTVSTIPRGEAAAPEAPTPGASPGGEGGGGGQKTKGCAPAHQPADSQKWVYPSEQQFYNAMRRKGWEVPDESTVPWIVQIHNAVNERGWAEVRRWESTLHGCDDPKLVRFLGRPTDTSPRAWFNTNVLMYRPPFDRHDWYVDRGDGGGPRRYVIDFYDGNDGGGGRSGSESRAADASFASGAPPPPRPPAMYLDVRPALDDADAFVDRAKMFVRDAFPGLFAAFGTTGGDAGGSTGGASNGTSASGVPKSGGAPEN